MDLLFFLSGFSVVIKLKIRFIPGKTLLGIKNKSPKISFTAKRKIEKKGRFTNAKAGIVFKNVKTPKWKSIDPLHRHWKKLSGQL